MLVQRSANNFDGPAIFALLSAVLAEFGLAPDPQGTDRDISDIEGNYLRDGGWFVVLVDEAGMILGSAGLFPVDGDTLELRKMYLHPSLRGLGWGKKLLREALAFARTRNMKRVVLETSSRLTAAIALYERHGFVRHHPEPLAGRRDQGRVLTLS